MTLPDGNEWLFFKQETNIIATRNIDTDIYSHFSQSFHYYTVALLVLREKREIK